MSPLCLKSWNGFPSIVSHRIKPKSLQQPARSPMTCPHPWPLCSQRLLLPPFIHSYPTGLSAPARPSVGNPLPQMHQFSQSHFLNEIDLDCLIQHIQDWPWRFHSTTCLSPTSLPCSAVLFFLFSIAFITFYHTRYFTYMFIVYPEIFVYFVVI